MAETKNGGVVRKHLGHGHIPAKHAEQLDTFNRHMLSPHRPCFFPVEVQDNKGRVRKRYLYQAMMTPYDKLKSLPKAARYLKPGITFERLDAQAHQIEHNEAARRLNEARIDCSETSAGRKQEAADTSNCPTRSNAAVAADNATNQAPTHEPAALTQSASPRLTTAVA